MGLLAQLDRPFLDALAISRDSSLWRRISRGEAIQACRGFPVAVLHRALSREAASWFDGSNRFYKADGPYSYESLRYYQFTGVSAERGLLKGLVVPPKPQPMEWETMEAVDQATGELLSLGSPTTKVPLKPAVPKTSKPPDASIPDIPGIADIPGLPVIPSIPEIPDIPEIPKIPEVPVLPAVPKIPLPIEILLTDAQGIPLPHASFQVEFPDGEIRSGKSDQTGLIRFPDNTQLGNLLLKITGLQDKAA